MLTGIAVLGLLAGSLAEFFHLDDLAQRTRIAASLSSTTREVSHVSDR